MSPDAEYREPHQWRLRFEHDASRSCPIPTPKVCPSSITGVLRRATGVPVVLLSSITDSSPAEFQVIPGWGCESPPDTWCAGAYSARPAPSSSRIASSILETRLFGSLRSPNMMALDGQAAGTRSRFRRRAPCGLAFPPDDLCVIDALHAVRALLHDAAAAHRHIGIALQLDDFGVSQSWNSRKLNRRTL